MRNKLYFLICILFLSVPYKIQAQNNLIKGTIHIHKNQNVLNKTFNQYEIFKIPSQVFSSSLKNASSPVVQLDLGDKNWEMVLHPVDLRSKDYKLRVVTSNGEIQMDGLPINSYQGYLLGKSNSEIRLTVDQGFIYGFIQDGKETFYIEPLFRFQPNAKKDLFVIYNKKQVISQDKSCGFNDAANQMESIKDKSKETQSQNRMACMKVELAIAADYSMYEKYGGIHQVTNFTIGTMNMVAADYTGAFNDDFSFEITEQYVVACEGCDPWTSSTSASTLLNSFSTWSNANFFNNFDLGQFWSNRDFDGSTIGLAHLPGLCWNVNSKHHILQDFSSNADLTRVLTSHEIGHNFGASHDASTGFIMSSSVNVTSAWSAASITAVDNHVAAMGPCLSACASPACDEVTDLTLVSSTSTSVDLTWVSTGSDFHVRARTVGGGAWDIENTTTSTSATLSGLTPCTSYEIQVSSDCSGTEGAPYTFVWDASWIKINSVSIGACDGTNYDVNIEVIHNGGTSSGMIVNVDGTDYPVIAYGTSPQTLTVSVPTSGLPNEGTANIPLTVSDATTSVAPCLASTTFDGLGSNCACIVLADENFNTCALPSGWANNTITSGGSLDEWQFDDETRSVLNYSAGSIDGTCMAYFDDDVFTNIGGEMELVSPMYDISTYEDLALSFEYDFHTFSGVKPAPNDVNASYFTVEVFDGTSWVNVLTANSDNCGFSSFWSCPIAPVSIDIDAYRNANFQMRFTYNDDGKWAGAVGLDNIKICGFPSCTPPTQIPTAVGTYTATSECTDATGWTHYTDDRGTTGDPSDDLLLLSIKKDATVDISPAQVTVGVNAVGGFSDLSSAGYVNTSQVSNWYTMNRYWNVNPTTQPGASGVEVRMYFSDTDYTDVTTQITNVGGFHNTPTDLEFFKFSTGSGIDPNPANGHVGGTTSNYIVLDETITHYTADMFYEAEFSVSSFSGGGGGGGACTGGPCGALPIELTDFKAALIDEHVLLTWTTATEINNAGFELERRTKDTEFKKMTWIEGQGTTYTPSYYTHQDRKLTSGQYYYYRLKQIDFDGSFSYSPIISIYLKKKDFEYQFSPNPIQNEGILSIQQLEKSDIKILVSDVSGKIVYQQTLELAEGFHQIPIDSKHWAEGVYFLQVQDADEITNYKLLKVGY